MQLGSHRGGIEVVFYNCSPPTPQRRHPHGPPPLSFLSPPPMRLVDDFFRSVPKGLPPLHEHDEPHDHDTQAVKDAQAAVDVREHEGEVEVAEVAPHRLVSVAAVPCDGQYDAKMDAAYRHCCECADDEGCRSEFRGLRRRAERGRLLHMHDGDLQVLLPHGGCFDCLEAPGSPSSCEPPVCDVQWSE